MSLLLAAGCYKLDDDDCKSYRTCPGDLAAAYQQLDRVDCADCLKRECRPSAEACSSDFACNRSVRCMLEPDPRRYQECLVGLWEQKVSTPRDEKGPWKGDLRLFKGCLETCGPLCGWLDSDWLCRGWARGDVNVGTTVDIAVQLFGGKESPGPKPAAHVLVKQCSPVTDCSEQVGLETKEDGVVTMTIEKTALDKVYFAVKSEKSGLDFPPTYFYPSYLSPNVARQPIAIVLVSTAVVKEAKERLSLAERARVDPNTGLLVDAGQSFILPDACRPQANPSAEQVFLQAQIDGQAVRRCEDAITGDQDPAIPCVWYSDEGGAPAKNLKYTDGWGGGVTGFRKGDHEVRVCGQDGLVLARRTLRMEPGWLTIARTWPLNDADQKEAGECEPAAPANTPDPLAN